MKLSKYAAMVKREAYCSVIRTKNDGVWLGLNGAMYRAEGMPEFYGKEQARAILSLDEKQMDKVFLQEYDVADSCDVLGFNLRSYDVGEKATKPVNMVAVVKGLHVSALRTNGGELVFYNENYLDPLQDVTKDSEFVELTVRSSENGQRYIAVKDGFKMLGIILPSKILSNRFLEDLRNFETICAEQLLREQERESAESYFDREESEEQTSMEEDN